MKLVDIAGQLSLAGGQGRDRLLGRFPVGLQRRVEGGQMGDHRLHVARELGDALLHEPPVPFFLQGLGAGRRCFSARPPGAGPACPARR
jgi:hypothetical protein